MKLNASIRKKYRVKKVLGLKQEYNNPIKYKKDEV